MQFFVVQVLWGFAAFVAGTLIFDFLHFLLHLCINSKNSFLQKLGYLHRVHHFFYNRKLQFNDRYFWENIWFELPLELVCQLTGQFAFFLICRDQMQLGTFYALAAISVARTVFVMLSGGRDSNHVAVEKLQVDRIPLVVDLNYHGLHHIYPDAYYASFVRWFDWVLGTSLCLDGRRIAITGASGAFGSGMIAYLNQYEKRVKSIVTIKYLRDYTYDDYSKLPELLEDVDVLILAHGSKVKDAMKANNDSFREIIECFREVKAKQQPILIPPEVWAVGSEIEFHPAWGNPDLQIYLESKRAYMHYAKSLYISNDILYRHIVPSAFTSPMGPGLISGKTAAAWAMFFIKRGWYYVPVTYSGLAFLHYFKFAFFVRPQPAKSKHGD